MSPVDISPATAFAHVARRAPHTVSLTGDAGPMTAAEVQACVEHLAVELAAAGVGVGDRVAYLGRNSPDLLITLLASAHLGAVFVPLNFRLAVPEARQVLQHCDARVAVVEPDLTELCASLRDHVPVGRWLGCPSSAAHAAARTPDRPVPPRVPREFDDLALLMYTSGTTGRPKGVMLTHGNLWWSATDVDEVFDTRPDDVTLAVAPLFHIGGLNAFTLRTLVRGGTVVVRRTFDAAQTLEDLLGGVTCVFGVPAMFAAVGRCAGFATADLSGVRAAIVAGAPVPPALIHLYAERGMLLQQSWGMTETAPAATWLPAHRTLDKAGSVGLPLPHTRIRLVEPGTGAEVHEPGRPAEILVSGPNVTPGYWADEDCTRESFDVRDGVRWLRTGDLAELDDEGLLTIVGRRKHMINTGGENVYPAEVERALCGMPGVTEVAVVGVPHPEWGETVAAVLERADGAAVDIEDVRAFAARSIARYKLPTVVVTVAELPRNGTGKVDRAAIHALAVAAAP
ncbi:AMP-binding protein [Actinotalea subterranea]|uniref:AMP-binding protein n=1 Tax=Actinotalea subterranea TaxID=2607497 RepID=UPI0011F093FD|nr:AMP-binding protein [Actinotalea subterranea]